MSNKLIEQISTQWLQVDIKFWLTDLSSKKLIYMQIIKVCTAFRNGLYKISISRIMHNDINMHVISRNSYSSFKHFTGRSKFVYVMTLSTAHCFSALTIQHCTAIWHQQQQSSDGLVFLLRVEYSWGVHNALDVHHVILHVVVFI